MASTLQKTLSVLAIALLPSLSLAQNFHLFATVPVASVDTELWNVHTGPPFSAVLVDSFGAIKAGSGLDFSPMNGMLYSSTGFGDGGKLYTVDTTSGNAVLIGATGFAAVPGLAFAPNGSLFGSAVYGPSNISDVLIRIDPATGAGTRIGVYGALGPDSIRGLDGIAFDPTTGILYGAAGLAIAQRPGHFFSIDTTTGLATYLGALREVVTGDTLPTTPAGLTFDDLGNCFASLGSNDGRIIRIYLDSLRYEYYDTIRVNHSTSDIAIPRTNPSTSIISARNRTPGGFALLQNYPNPFNPSTIIEFTIPEDGHVTLKVYDLAGRQIATLVDGELTARVYHQVVFDASKLASGTYVARMNANGKQMTRRMVLVR